MSGCQRGRECVHQGLRRATAAAHHELDHHPFLQRLVRNGLTLVQYTESLAAMYRPHACLERQVFNEPWARESGLSLSLRLGRLADDLTALECPIPPLPAPIEHQPAGRAAWCGRLYVLEGSRLGSVFIARQLHASLGDGIPCRFFGEAEAVDVRGALKAMLERELADRKALEKAAEAACMAFYEYRIGLDEFDRRQPEPYNALD